MRIPAAILSLTAALLLLCSRAGAQEGDCARFNRADMATQLIEAYVVKTNATLYLNAGDATSSSSLKFNDHVVVLDRSPDGARIKVDRKDSQNPANGWIEKTNLICVNEAVRNNQTKLYQRVYVRTERYHTQGAAPAPAGALDRGEAVTLYQNTNQQCEGGPNACARVTRFDWFYIWAEEGDYYLISTFYSFKSRRPGVPQPMFMGWLAKSRGIPWSTGIGLRPSIELAESRGPDNDEKYVCAYASPEDIGKETEDPTKCSRTYGGRRWFKRNSRLALLEETDRYYRVAAAASLFGNESRDADPAAAGGRSLYDGMDVVFVVDGTASMIKAIAAIKGGDGRPGLVQIISRKLATQLKDVGGVRFGFQIYRDSAPIQISRQDGVTDPDIERLALSTTSCAGNAEEFENAFGAVTAKEPVFPGTYVDDDDPENGFLGVYVALNQFSSCPNHMKVLIQIGDHGYDANKQRQRGQRALDVETLAAKMRQATATGYREPVMYLAVQTPRDKTGVKQADKYDQAYDMFTNQAKEIAKQSRRFRGDARTADAATDQDLNDPVKSPVQQMPLTGDYYEELTNRVTRQVTDRFTSISRGARTIEQLHEQTGRPISELIDQYSGTENAPMDTQIWLKQRLCAGLGDRCATEAVDAVGEVYLAHNADSAKTISFDVLMFNEELQRWNSLINGIDQGVGTPRDLLVRALLTKISTIFRFDPNRDRSLLDQLSSRSALPLPGAVRGILLKYSPAELQSISDCEIGRVVAYARVKGDALNILSGGKERVILKEQTNDLGCRGAPMRADRRVPMIRQDRVEKFAPADAPASERDNYRIDFEVNGAVYFWLPIEYLP
jgi:hypothetical protein